MILAMSNIAWPPETRNLAYSAMAEFGVGGLEVAPGMLFFRSANPFRPKRTEVKRALEEIEAAGLRLVSMQSLLYGLEGASLFGDDDGRTRFRDGMNRAIDLAGMLGIPNLVFGSPRQRFIPEGLPRDRARMVATEIFHQLGNRAAAVGTVIAMEANPTIYGTNFLTTLEETRVFVVELGHSAVRLVLDLGSMVLNGEAADTASYVTKISSLISHVHVSEPHLRPAPADAAALRPVLAALREEGYAGAVSIEMIQPEGGISTLRHSLAALCSAAVAGGAR
jgi:sugar phosphate isomerase/epimerase